MGIRSTIQTRLLAASTITAVVGQRIYTTDDLPKSGVSGVANLKINGFLPPTLVIAGKSDRTTGAVDRGALRFIDLYFYQERGGEALEGLALKVRSLLHKKYITPDDDALGMMYSYYIYSNPEGRLPELADNASYMFSRYGVLYTLAEVS